MAAKILVVDDEPSVLAVVSRALREEGHEVIAGLERTDRVRRGPG
jgi:Response regulator containing CheY-like receiver, AAA-type ATPase, and DNA-binding domains